MSLLKRTAYRLGRWLMHTNYIKGADAVEYDLRLEVAELKREVSRLRIEAAIRKVTA